MGGQAIPGNVTIDASIGELQARVSQLDEDLKKIESAAADMSPVLALGQLMRDAFFSASEVSPERKIPDRHADYFQAVRSIDQFIVVSREYASSPSEEKYNKAADIAGHFRDRIAQNILVWAGRESLKKLFDEMMAHHKFTINVLRRLHGVAMALDSFVDTQATRALHNTYNDDRKKYKNGSILWFWLSTASFLIVMGLLYYSNLKMPAFINGLSLPSGAPNLALAVAVAPRIGVVLVAVFCVIMCWRNYNTYKHLEIGARRRESAALVLPLLIDDEKNQEGQAQLRKTFLSLMASAEETGFIAQAKQRFQIGPISTSGE